MRPSETSGQDRADAYGRHRPSEVSCRAPPVRAGLAPGRERQAALRPCPPRPGRCARSSQQPLCVAVRACGRPCVSALWDGHAWAGCAPVKGVPVKFMSEEGHVKGRPCQRLGSNSALSSVSTLSRGWFVRSLASSPTTRSSTSLCSFLRSWPSTREEATSTIRSKAPLWA